MDKTLFKTRTIALFAAEAHSGFNSRGYKLLSALQRRLTRHGQLERFNVGFDDTKMRQSELYRSLVRKYGAKM